MRAFAQQLESIPTASLDEISQWLGRIVDAEFCDHCRIVSVDKRVLVLNVDQPSRVSWMRLRWQTRLNRALKGAGGRPGIDRVWFRFGRDGAAIEPQDVPVASSR